MSNIDKALRHELLKDESIKALVGRRIYAVDLEQNTKMPAMTYQRIDSPRKVFEHGNGSSFPDARYQIGNWSGSFDGAEILAAVVAKYLNGKKGIWGTGENKTEVENCQVVDVRDYKDASSILYNRQIDVKILFKE